MSMRRTFLALLLPFACSDPAPQPAALPAPIEAPAPTPPPESPAKPPELPPISPDMLEVPHIDIEVDGCTVDLGMPFFKLAPPFASLVAVAGRPTPGSSSLPVDCTAPVIAELPGDVLAAEWTKTSIVAPSLRVRVDSPHVPCGQVVTFGFCLRDRAGTLHASYYAGKPAPATAYGLERRDLQSGPRLLTPSGALADTSGVSRGWQLVGADPISGARARVDVRSVRRAAGPTVTLRLTTGEQLELFHAREVWHAGRASWVRASQVVAGDRLLGLEGPVEVQEAQQQKADRWDIDIADVGAPDTYFLGSVLVRDGKPTSGAATPLPPEEDPSHRADVEVFAAPQSYDCSLSTHLTIREWPADAAAIALLVEDHPGPPGARVPLACDAKHEFTAVPRALWDAWRADPSNSGRTLTLRLEAGDVGCSSDTALTACARASDGSLSPLMPLARWGLSGPVCFAAGTPIDTPEGPVAIESLTRGAEVRSFDVETGEPRVAHVLRGVSRGLRPVFKIRLEDGDELRLTGEHPLWLPRVGAFHVAGSLRAGDHLLGHEGERRIESIAPDGAAEVWELSVDGPDTYFAAGVLAHNY